MMNKLLSNLSISEIEEIKSLKDNPTLYEDLANSLFPSVFGQI